MLTINAIDLSKLRNAEYVQLSKDILGIINTHNKTTLKVADEYDAFNTIATDIATIFKTDQGSLLTPVIEALDARRDKAVLGIYAHINSYTYHFVQAKVDAANVLLNQLKVFGTASDIAATALPAETAIISSLVNDFAANAAQAAAIAELGLTAWAAELKTANDLLAQKYMERTVELGGANPNTIKDKRLQANTLYYDLRNMLQSQATVAKGAAPFTQAINEINALIDQYNIILANRTADAAKANNSGGGNTPTT